MNSRFLTNILLMLLGAFTVVASMAWAPFTFQWLMFGAGIVGTLLIGGTVIRRRGPAQRGLDAATGVLGAWTIIASLVFSGVVVTWLGFASGCGFVAFALAGLAAHEFVTERVVHSLEVRTTRGAVADHEYSSING